MLTVASTIDRAMGGLGEVLKWALPIVVALAAAVALLRYGFSLGYPWLSESFVWLNGAMIFLGAASVYAWDGHVRVDLLYRRLGKRGRAIVNLVGTVIFLWPMLAVIAVKGWPALVRSWSLLEGSPSIDGLPFLYLMKTAVLAFCILTALQGLATVLRSLHVLLRASESSS
ncbi:TRAP transporter small permease subunit [Amorphus orientalis]|uniref:TRAP transporter small permease protein n=1 Tax=Amorphus orientalis TaxID=649198 RepID=A0AAE4AT17_9HYPH|nr:TRAP transporter small permease subunit [Amorphus orientalis]MDQ0315600.1 TRAP-type mannitol/chloroaromatic compound transport system permease small subunit [Amorphus orientalis]